jgi:hypothetical protein
MSPIPTIHDKIEEMQNGRQVGSHKLQETHMLSDTFAATSVVLD